MEKGIIGEIASTQPGYEEVKAQEAASKETSLIQLSSHHHKKHHHPRNKSRLENSNQSLL